MRKLLTAMSPPVGVAGSVAPPTVARLLPPVFRAEPPVNVPTAGVLAAVGLLLAAAAAEAHPQDRSVWNLGALPRLSHEPTAISRTTDGGSLGGPPLCKGPLPARGLQVSLGARSALRSSVRRLMS